MPTWSPNRTDLRSSSGFTAQAGSSSPTSGAGSRKARTPLGGSGIKPVNLSKFLGEPPIVGQRMLPSGHWETWLCGFVFDGKFKLHGCWGKALTRLSGVILFIAWGCKSNGMPLGDRVPRSKSFSHVWVNHNFDIIHVENSCVNAGTDSRNKGLLSKWVGNHCERMCS